MSIQLVWFTAEARKKDATTVYELVTGVEPDTTQSNKSPSPNNPQLSLASGVVGYLNYTATVQLGRIDLVVQAVSQTGNPELIDNTEDVISKIVTTAATAGDLLPAVNRLALVVQLAQLSDDHSSATKVVDEAIGSVLPFDNAQDLNFQVSRRRKIPTVRPVSINRLLRFSVMTYGQFNIMNGLAEPILLSSFASHLMIDVNTTPTTVAFSPIEQSEIWQHLLGESLRLRADGTISGLVEGESE